MCHTCYLVKILRTFLLFFAAAKYFLRARKKIMCSRKKFAAHNFEFAAAAGPQNFMRTNFAGPQNRPASAKILGRTGLTWVPVRPYAVNFD